MTPRRIRVYVVDDHALVREWLGNLLRLQQDMTLVGEHDDVDGAWREISELLPDVVVIDLSLKRGNGVDLIGMISGDLQNVKPLVMSMHEEVSEVERAFRAGARGYVMKASATSQIIPAIREVHGGKLHAEPYILALLTERTLGRLTPPAKIPEDLLSDRELEVFRALGAGYSTRRIADDMNISHHTVQTYCARIKEKLCLDDGRQLLRAAMLWTRPRPS